MKIAILSHAYLEREYQKNIQALAAYVTVRVILPAYAYVSLFSKRKYAPLGSENEYCRAFRPLHLFGSQYLLLTLTMGFRRFKPDIIVVEYNPWSIMFLQTYFCRLFFCSKAKLVCHVKKNTYRRYPGFRGLLKNWFTRFTIKHVDHFIAVGDMVINLYQHDLAVPAARISKCRQLGVDTSLFNPVSENGSKKNIVIGYCGRFDRDKGVMELVEGVRLLCERVKVPVALKLMGMGSLTGELKKLAQERGYLEVLPSVENTEVVHFFRQLDIFVLPSLAYPDHQEHDAHVLMEALSMGLAVVATKVGIVPEMLGDGSGKLVNPEAPEEIAAALVELVGNPETRKKLGQRAREKAEREFALDVVARRKFEILKEIS